MSGHSHWARIRHKKQTQDARKGKLFSKLIRVVTISVQQGGSDSAFNSRLDLAVQKAKDAGIPKETIEKAIKKGAGGLEGQRFEEVLYEGYGPAGVALLVEAITDNRNRTTGEIRKVFEHGGGNLGGANSVVWIFEKKGHILVKKEGVSEETLFEKALDAGAEDVRDQEDMYEVICEPKAFEAVKQALAGASISPESAELTLLPKTLVPVDEAIAKRVLSLMEALDEHDDVQNVYTNFDAPAGLALPAS